MLGHMTLMITNITVENAAINSAMYRLGCLLGSLASGGPLSSICWYGFCFLQNLILPERFLMCLEISHKVDMPQLLEFHSLGFCLLEKLSESIKGFLVNDFYMIMTFLIGCDKCFILPKSCNSNKFESPCRKSRSKV